VGVWVGQVVGVRWALVVLWRVVVEGEGGVGGLWVAYVVWVWGCGLLVFFGGLVVWGECVWWLGDLVVGIFVVVV